MQSLNPNTKCKTLFLSLESLVEFLNFIVFCDPPEYYDMSFKLKIKS